MEFYEVRHKCQCGSTLIIPITPEIEAKAKGDYDLAQVSATTKLACLEEWLNRASLITLIKFWFKGR